MKSLRIMLMAPLACGAAAADVVPVSRYSTMETDYLPQPQSDIWMYTELGYISVPYQTSTTSAAGASGQLSATGIAWESGARWMPYNSFQYLFDITEPTDYTLQGQLAASAAGASSGSQIELSGPGLSFARDTRLVVPLPFATSGTLRPGRYRLWASCGIQGPASFSASCGFTLTLVPCYANCDGSSAMPALNISDFLCFMNRFAAGEFYANCDGSTAPPVLNINDFVCYMGKFAAGCGP